MKKTNKGIYMSYEIDWDADDIDDVDDLVSELNTENENTVVTPNSFAGWSEASSKLEKEGVSDEG
jgi:hypothetical protein